MNGGQETPLVSVVIPAYNRAGLIGRAIDSVLQQTHADLEVIVVDDASTDNTGEVVKAIGDTRIRYIRCERNAGASAARNTGIAAAAGRFVAFLDSDDVWMPEKLTLQLAVLLACDDPEQVVCYSQVIVDTGSARVVMPTAGKQAGEPVGDYVFGHRGLIHTSSLVLSRTLAQGTLFPVDQRKHEDWDVFLRLEQQGVSWRFVDWPLAVWHNEPREGRLTNLAHDSRWRGSRHTGRCSRTGRSAASWSRKSRCRLRLLNSAAPMSAGWPAAQSFMGRLARAKACAWWRGL